MYHPSSLGTSLSRRGWKYSLSHACSSAIRSSRSKLASTKASVSGLNALISMFSEIGCSAKFIALTSTILCTVLWHCDHAELCISFQNDREARYPHSLKAFLCHCHSFTRDLSA